MDKRQTETLTRRPLHRLVRRFGSRLHDMVAIAVALLKERHAFFENCYLIARLLKVRAKNRVLLFESRRLRFLLRQTLLDYRGEWNLRQYVSDFTHNVLMMGTPNNKLSGGENATDPKS